MSDQPRPVWLTADEIDLPHHELYALLDARFIAAPADAEHVAERGILQTFPDLRSVRVSLSMDASELAATICARNVLRGLGMPDR